MLNNLKVYLIYLFIFTILSLSIILVGCIDFNSSEKKLSKIVVVFVDHSKSTANDLNIQTKAMNLILDKLDPGDRLVMAPITSSSTTDFNEHIDVTLPILPERDLLLDIESQFKHKLRMKTRALEIAMSDLTGQVKNMLAQESNSMSTTIIESITIAETYFNGDDRRGVLVIISDMIEESSVFNMAKQKLTNKFIEDELSREAKIGIIPNLKDVSVYVVGLKSKSLERQTIIENFWKQYFLMTEANLIIARSLVSFEE